MPGIYRSLLGGWFWGEGNKSRAPLFKKIKMLVQAISNAKSFKPEIVKTALLELHYEGASGTIHFDSKGGVRKLPDIYSVKGGTRTRIGSAEELIAN